MEPDFSGWATKYGIECTDGRTLVHGSFDHMDGKKVPLIFQHVHDDSSSVLGHAILEKRDEGVYAYCFTNNNPKGKEAKEMVAHGDIDQLSIYANRLRERPKNVVQHGDIKEVSLVLAGANEGARIDYVALQHDDGNIDTSEDEAVIYSGENISMTKYLKHEDDSKDGEKTVKDVVDSMNEEQKNVLHYLVGQALENGSAEHDDFDEDEDDLSHSDQEDSGMNVFDRSDELQHTQIRRRRTLTDDQIKTIFNEAQKNGSLRETILAHADEYGITNIEVLFPDAKNVDTPPVWVTRNMEWVSGVINGTKHVPFSRFKSRSADLTHEEARARGYIKATIKKDQFFEIVGREYSPQTVYKRQKIDRDDLIDVTDFDIVAWFWQELRFMLEEEIARAILIGDGRDVADPDKINENKIRPIAKDHEFYAHKVIVGNHVGDDLVDDLVRARRYYKGRGEPTFYTTEAYLSDCLLAKDSQGKRIYKTEAELASAMRVKNIVTVEVMEGSDYSNLVGIVVNLADYWVGTDKGGEITKFDDFDIDYNQYKYLIETRLSGGLVHPKTALVLFKVAAAETGEAPSLSGKGSFSEPEEEPETPEGPEEP